MKRKALITLFALSAFTGLFVLSAQPVWAQDKQEGQEGLVDREFTFVTDPVWTTPSKSQGYTGTCWCFSTTSFVESEAYRKTGEKFELSEMFTVYNCYLEKAERYLRLHGKAQFGEGGLSHDLLYTIPRYGIVRDSDYTGMKPEQKMHNHGAMFAQLESSLNEMVKQRRGPGESWKDMVKQILDSNIGPLPKTVNVDGSDMTPVAFADKVLEFNSDEYVEITSYAHLPFYEQVELLVPDNWLRYEKYYNAPLDEFIAIMDNALKNGYSVVLDLDVGEPTIDRTVGVSWTEEDLNSSMVTQEERQAMFDDWRTTDDHLEHTVGIARDQDGRKYYYTKDSGGPQRYQFDGFNFLSENYVRAKVLAFMVHKDGVPAEMREKLGIK